MRIVYNSFHGRYSDNPRALFERLGDRPGLEQLWLADPAHAASFPSDVRTLDIEGADAVRALESADLLVANTHTELEWEKRPGTTYLQTWHGTPLKRIHNDVLWAPEGRLERLDRDIAKWDLMISPNAVSTPRLRAAFGYGGRLEATGYPRNDLLSRSEGQVEREQTRKALDIEPGTTAVLYAPTWRDDEVFAEGAPEIAIALDVARLTEQLGPNVVLMVRSHNMVTGRARLDRLPGVIDVSYHADIRDLYLAADVLVTDYSSVMFDFAVTGKPIVIYAYDLDRFRDTVRGFYFDPVPGAPGPVLSRSDEVIEALADLDGVRERYADSYAAFRDTYCGLEDGGSSDRVLALLGL